MLTQLDAQHSRAGLWSSLWVRLGVLACCLLAPRWEAYPGPSSPAGQAVGRGTRHGLSVLNRLLVLLLTLLGR